MINLPGASLGLLSPYNLAHLMARVGLGVRLIALPLILTSCGPPSEINYCITSETARVMDIIESELGPVDLTKQYPLTQALESEFSRICTQE